MRKKNNNKKLAIYPEFKFEPTIVEESKKFGGYVDWLIAERDASYK